MYNKRKKCVHHPTPKYNTKNKDLKPANSHKQPKEQSPQTVQLPHTTHGTKASNCPTPMYNPWNKGLKLSNSHVQPMDEGLKPSNSHIQPMEQRPQTVQLPHTTHGTKASNCPTPTYNPWNKGLKLSNSHIQPMERRHQTHH